MSAAIPEKANAKTAILRARVIVDFCLSVGGWADVILSLGRVEGLVFEDLFFVVDFANR
jgi:hypothetical protein